MTDILSIGELLIDLTQTGTVQNIPQYSANPGGAPANVAVAAARLGANTAFTGKVGADRFGRFLRDILHENKVCDRFLYEDASAPTTMAVVSVDPTGERSFSFYRTNSADTRLTREETSAALALQPKILHFGSVSLTEEPSRSATLSAVAQAKLEGCLISYDPNYRPALWPDVAAALHWMKAPLPFVDILKVSDEELPLLSGTDDLVLGSAQLAKQGVRLVLVTLGERGVFYRLDDHTGLLPGVPTRVADTNGAGDTFLGAVLSRLCPTPSLDLNIPELEDILTFANRAASYTCSHPGAIPAMPTLNDLK